MCEKELLLGIHQTENFLEKKENQAWNSKERLTKGREEWNNYHYKSGLLCKSKLLTDQWGGKPELMTVKVWGEKK